MKIFTSIILLFLTSLVFAQDKGAVQGVVLDKEMNQEPLAFAKVYIKDSNTNSTTDLYGTYYMDIEPGTYTLVFDFTGYKKVEVPNVTINAGKVTNLENILIGALQVPRFSSGVANSVILKETTTASIFNN